MRNQKRWKTENAGPENDVLFNEYAGFKVIYVYVPFMGVPLQFVNKHVFTVILLKVHWADSDLFTRAKHIMFFCMNACERFVCVPLQCLNKTLLYCIIYPCTNYTYPPFSGPVFVVLYFQVLHFHVLTFGPSFSGPA